MQLNMKMLNGLRTTWYFNHTTDLTTCYVFCVALVLPQYTVQGHYELKPHQFICLPNDDNSVHYKCN